MMRLASRSLLLCLLPMLHVGCAEELGPEALTTAEVRGRIVVRGEPVGPGWVEFAPIDGTIGLVSSARLNADGTFLAKRVPVGMVGLRLAGVRLPATTDPGLNRSLFLFTQASLIHRRVDASVRNTLDVDLAVEAAKTSLDAAR